MGEVYRARDANLGRDPATKVLTDAFAQDAERLARFEREAKTLAALNHPNIAHVYGLEQADGVRGLVMELVEGPTLADRIASGAIPLDEALPIARQIAEALEAAHEQGIAHRDLKPANIKLRRDGAVKVLDFGLAKLVEPGRADGLRRAGADISQSPTITSPAMLTSAGVILGTAAYMAPEQAKGQPADKRSDIWAFGCVLFEMLTGRRAFEGHVVTETLAHVLTKEPDWSLLPAELPAAVRVLLTRCLERERRKRIGDVAALRFVLDEIANLSIQPVRGGRISNRPRATPVVWAIASAVLIAAVAAAYWYRPLRQPQAFTFSILAPEGTKFASVSQGGAPALSPDGRQIAYVADGSAGRLLWVQSVDAFNARPLTGTEGAMSPFWSPDGAWLGFIAGPSLKKVSVAGGQPQVIARAFGSALGTPGGTWNRAGDILFYGGRNNTLASIPASGGEVVQATERNVALFDENHLNPAFLPDGRHYLLSIRGGPDLQFQVWVGALGTNERRPLLKDVANVQYAPSRSGNSGYLVYVRNGKLIAQRFNVDSQTIVGTTMTIAEGVGVTGGGGVGDFTTAANGVLAYRRAELGTEEMTWYDRAGKETGAIGDRAGNPRNNLRVSPDGKWAAFTRLADAGQDVWIA